MSKIKHFCEDCAVEFEVDQGSRRNYCDKCTQKRLSAAGKASSGTKRGVIKGRKDNA